jgi:hypothetical protein
MRRGLIGTWDYVCATMSVGLWCAGVEHRDSSPRLRWRSCGLVLMDWERWRTSVRFYAHSCEDVAEWAVLPARSRIGGTCVQDMGDTHMARYSGRFGGWASKPPCATDDMVLLSSGPKTRWWLFRRESVATCCVIAKVVSRWSNFVWSAWSSDRKPRSWIDSM